MTFKLKALAPRVGTLNTQRVQRLTTDTQRITGSTWQKTRDRILRRDKGLCQCPKCQAPGAIPLIAHEVDHRIPLWEPGGTNDDSNLWSLNRDCHKKKTADEAKRRAGK
jgi:5-methylcytosine-specific restriction protein A